MTEQPRQPRRQAARSEPPPLRRNFRHKQTAVAGGGQALAIAEFLQQHPDDNAVYLAKNSLDASHLFEEFSALAPQFSVAYLPDWDILPYENFSPTPALAARRIAVLAQRLNHPPRLTIAPAVCALLPYAPGAYFAARAFCLNIGDTLAIDAVTGYLHLGGYNRCPRVLAPGEYAVYGGQVDIFPPESETPFRLVLDDDTIEQIRLFDPTTQRSTQQVRKINLQPVCEYELSEDNCKEFCRRFLEFFETADEIIYPAIRKHTAPPGIESYLPLFYDNVGRLFDFMTDDPVIMINEDLSDTFAAFFHQARLRQKVAGVYEGRPALPVQYLFLAENDFFRRLRDFRTVQWQAATDNTVAPMLPSNPRLQNPLSALTDFISQHIDDGGRVCIAVDNKGRREALTTRLQENPALPPPVVREQFALDNTAPLTLITAPLRRGFILPKQQLAVLTEYEIFQLSVPPRANRQSALHTEAISINEIREGDVVTHQEYGVGIARDLKNKEVDGKVGEYLEIEYADKQLLWLPVSQMSKLSRHHGEATLSQLGGKAWQRAAARAQRRAYDTAARLLEINAKRAAAAATAGNACVPDKLLLNKFIGDFPYVETPDQEKTAQTVCEDLLSDKPMDRLVCADVGFGKTEIALRAAATVAFAKKQVALIAPTTLLAQQHHRVFSDRFADFPVRIASLTRFAAAKERKDILAGIQNGSTDIVIGTHALLQKSVKFKNLGLAIIDEEHRFGVRHKEQFKQMRANVDLLALSATPIPRSLAMALGGVRDLSIMATPPLERLPIKTFVAPITHGIIAEAGERELRRGGQIFFIHNEIRDIETVGKQIQQWLPDAKLIIAHGQMPAAALESAMHRFLRRDADILLCTTIVESGLDIANANTIIINRADKMGLSRLHQLRGRVGRGSAQAYAYFLLAAHGESTRTAQLRLAAATDYGELGGSFSMSLRDLEIRGMGEILGEKQSGDIETVGCERYQAMVKSAMKKIQNLGAADDDEEETDIATLISLPDSALLPEQYIPSPNERIIYYRRLAACAGAAAVDEIFAELTDRFGAPPPAAHRLQQTHYLRLAAKPAQVDNIRINRDDTTTIKFRPNPRCAEALLAQIQSGNCRPTAPDSIRLPTDNIPAITTFLHTLTG